MARGNQEEGEGGGWPVKNGRCCFRWARLISWITITQSMYFFPSLSSTSSRSFSMVGDVFQSKVMTPLTPKWQTFEEFQTFLPLIIILNWFFFFNLKLINYHISTNRSIVKHFWCFWFFHIRWNLSWSSANYCSKILIQNSISSCYDASFRLIQTRFVH